MSNCNSGFNLPEPPAYVCCPPEPPAQGCSAVWGGITGTLGNQTDLVAYIQSQVQSGTRLYKTQATRVYPEGTGLTAIPEFTFNMASGSEYEILVNTHVGWEESPGDALLEADLVMPSGASASGTWMSADTSGIYASSIDVSQGTLGNLRSSGFDAPNIRTSHPSHFLVTTTSAGSFSVRVRVLGEGTSFIVYQGSWMTVRKLK